jgi:hypothetical protein
MEPLRKQRSGASLYQIMYKSETTPARQAEARSLIEIPRETGIFDARSGDSI